MIEFVTSPKGKIASDIFDQAKEALGVKAASNWMFTANAWLDGRSPIEAIRQGNEKDVRCAVGMLKERKAA